MKMPTLTSIETKAKVKVKIIIVEEEHAVQDVEADLIKEILSVIIVNGMVSLKGIVD
jgi:hypothetical protein